MILFANLYKLDGNGKHSEWATIKKAIGNPNKVIQIAVNFDYDNVAEREMMSFKKLQMFSTEELVKKSQSIAQINNLLIAVQ